MTEPTPVRTRTVTTIEIIPGTYGAIHVGHHHTPGWVDIGWGAPGQTAPDLRKAAATLTAIADALDAGARTVEKGTAP